MTRYANLECDPIESYEQCALKAINNSIKKRQSAELSYQDLAISIYCDDTHYIEDGYLITIYFYKIIISNDMFQRLFHNTDGIGTMSFYTDEDKFNTSDYFLNSTCYDKNNYMLLML